MLYMMFGESDRVFRDTLVEGKEKDRRGWGLRNDFLEKRDYVIRQSMETSLIRESRSRDGGLLWISRKISSFIFITGV